MALCITCYARDEYTVTDDTDTFTLSFDYVIPQDVNVALRNSTTKEYETISRDRWVFENLTTIKISPPPRADVVIYRCTDVNEPKAQFFPGNSIQADDLNANQRQVLNAIEELRCTIASLGGDGGGGGGDDLPGIGEPCQDGQCAGDLICVEGICLPPCDDGVCPEGYNCVGGICFPDCSDDGICPEGFVCVDGTCLVDCSDDGICPEGFTCIDGVCQPDNTEDAPTDGKLYGRQDAVWELAIPYDFTLLPEIVPPNETQPEPDLPVSETIINVSDAPSDGELYGRLDADWSTALLYNFTELPTFEEAEEEEESVSVFNDGSIEEAPVDGSMYGRKDASWSPALQYDLSTLTQLPKGSS